MAEPTRYCLYNPGGYAPSVGIYAGKDLLLGADFRIVTEDKTSIIESWKLSAENGGSKTRTISNSFAKLNRSYMIWQILFCATDPAVDTGEIEVFVKQDGQQCKLTLPALYKPENIPPCSVKNPLKLSGSLIFIAKT